MNNLFNNNKVNQITFDTVNGYSPNKVQDFAWLGEYINGTSICEFDFNTKQKNNFYKINKQNLIKFGLIGQGMKLYFDTATGMFYLNGLKVMLSYKTKEKEYNLTNSNQGIYNDIITYKDAFTDSINEREGKFSSSIYQYSFGYKHKLKYEDDTAINLQVVCSLPYNKPAYLQIKLVPNKDLDGELYIKRVGYIAESLHAPLKSEYAGICEWVIR